MFRILSLIVAAALMLGGCATFQADLAELEGIYTLATTTTVSADVVRPTANAFDVLKGTAANFAKYCVMKKFTPSGCDEDTRRKISTFVKEGTNARVQLRASVKTGQPALSTVYNLLVGALNGLKSTPAATFTGG